MDKKEYIKEIINETLSEYNLTLNDDELEDLSKNIENGLSVFVDYTHVKQSPLVDDRDLKLRQQYDFICLLGNRYGFTDWDCERNTIGVYEAINGRQCSNTIRLV